MLHSYEIVVNTTMGAKLNNSKYSLLMSSFCMLLVNTAYNSKIVSVYFLLAMISNK